MPQIPRFSIIVPMLGIEGLFDDTLASVLRYRPDNSEVIVVHDGTYSDPYLLRQEVKFVSADSRKHLIRFFNTGVGHADGEIVALLRPGIEITEGWESEIAVAFEDPKVGAASPALVTQKKPSVLIASGIKRNKSFLRLLDGAGTRLHSQRRPMAGEPLGPTSWAAFYRKSLLDQIGAIDDRLDQVYLDVELALTLSKLKFRSQFVERAVFNVGFPQQILREATTAHGLSAQRAISRHSNQPAFNRGLVSFLQEVVSSPAATWKFSHAFQRLGARKFQDADVAFAEKVRALRDRNELQYDSSTSLRRAA